MSGAVAMVCEELTAFQNRGWPNISLVVPGRYSDEGWQLLQRLACRLAGRPVSITPLPAENLPQCPDFAEICNAMDDGCGLKGYVSDGSRAGWAATVVDAGGLCRKVARCLDGCGDAPLVLAEK